MRFDSKISAIEERTNLDTMTMGELHGTLTTYEMRTEQEDSSRKEASFKASNKREQTSQSQNQRIATMMNLIAKRKPTSKKAKKRHRQVQR